MSGHNLLAETWWLTMLMHTFMTRRKILILWHILQNSLRHIYIQNPSLTDWGRETHICVSKVTIIGSDNGLSPDRRQAITWSNAGILLIWTLGTNFSEILRKIYKFIQEKAFQNVVWKIAAILSQPQCVKLIKHYYEVPIYPVIDYAWQCP